MSTKINVRSPYFLEFTEPTPTLGTFDCNAASLQNFAVSSAGVITEPTIASGNIIDKTATSFPENTSGSDISRSVTYTITIPDGYSNVEDGSIDCTVTADQPSQTDQEDPTQNDNCPTSARSFFDYVDEDFEESYYAFIILDTYFTAGSGAAISEYELIKYGGEGIDAYIEGNILNIKTTLKCVSANFIVVAKNAEDSCQAQSNLWSFNTVCTDDQDNPITFTCSDVNLTGGSVSQDGSHSKSSFTLGSVKELRYNGSVLASPYNVGANDTGSDRDITITYRMYIPQGYDNYSSGAYIDCDKTYTQPAVLVLPDFDCAEAGITNTFISKKGNVAEPDLARGTMVSWTPQSFPDVATDTLRTVDFTITAPSGYSNAGNNIVCSVDIYQPATVDDCGSTVLYLTGQGFSDFTGFCGTVYSANLQCYSNASSFADIRSSIGQRICRNGSLFRGGNKYYGYSQATTSNGAGDIGASFYVLKIDDFGIVQDIGIVNCSTSGGGKGGSL